MTIPIEKLKSIKTVVTHANCSDGLASAMIIRDVIPNVTVKFLNYNTKEHKTLAAESGMIFCDFSPDPNRVQEFVDVGAIVLDHHKYQEGVVAKFGELGVFADEVKRPGVAGAMLAYQEVWAPVVRSEMWDYLNSKSSAYLYPIESQIRELATLVSVRDTWQTESPLWVKAKETCSALRFFGWEYWLEHPSFSEIDLKVGRLLEDKMAKKVASRLETALRGKVNGLMVQVHQGVSVTSDLAEASELGIDLILGFDYLGFESDASAPKLLVSCRTRSDFDVGAFAKAHGGGGHTKAAGFTVDVKPEDPNPYIYLFDLVRAYSNR